MQQNDKVICAYAGKYRESGHLTTFGTYKVLSIMSDHGRDYVNIIDNSGAERTYIANRFVVQENT